MTTTASSSRTQEAMDCGIPRKEAGIVLSSLLIGFSLVGCAQNLLNPGKLSEVSLLTSSVSKKSELLPKATSAEACLRTAQQLDQQNHLIEAIQLYERAANLSPELKDKTNPRLAVLYAKQHNVAQARKYFQLALAESPKDADLYSDYAYFLMNSGDLTASDAATESALQLSPNHERASIHLAMLRGEQQDYDESFRLFEQAVGPAAAHSNLGVILAKHGKRVEAMSHLEKAQAIDPKLPVPPAFLNYFHSSNPSNP